MPAYSYPVAAGRLANKPQENTPDLLLGRTESAHKAPRMHVSAARRQQRPALTVVDNYSRECLAIHTGKLLKGEYVISIMEVLRMLDKRRRYVSRRITATSLSRKVWINGRMSMVSPCTSPVPESRQITRLLSHLTEVCGMNA